MKKIVFTGGGSAGHVTPNLPLIQHFLQQGWEVSYLGSETGIEHQLIQPLNIPYFPISTGKLRRYFSWQNFLDPFRILWGMVQAIQHLHTLKPDVVFSKGGFVAFPVVFAAWVLRIPVVAHESDLTPGLANRMSFPLVKTICVTFPDGAKYFKDSPKVQITGTPLREELFQGDAAEGRRLAKLTDQKPILMFIGGGAGSGVINQALRAALSALLQDFQIIHICGQGKLQSELSQPGYFQIEYANAELPHFYAAADCVISRSGANSVYEILALKKPHIFIPLSTQSSRGDQIHNANYFRDQGLSRVLKEETLTPELLKNEINKCFENISESKSRLANCIIESGTAKIAALITQASAS